MGAHPQTSTEEEERARFIPTFKRKKRRASIFLLQGRKWGKSFGGRSFPVPGEKTSFLQEGGGVAMHRPNILYLPRKKGCSLLGRNERGSLSEGKGVSALRFLRGNEGRTDPMHAGKEKKKKKERRKEGSPPKRE